MCNIWKMDHSGEASVEEFSKFIKDDLFTKVEYVGINGGEPSLITNLDEYVAEIVKLPSLKGINIISHGFSPIPLFKSLIKIYDICKINNISFHISISLDGVGEVHNTVRGKRNVFEKTTATIDEIIKNQHKYCDTYDVSCTVQKNNVDYLMELDVYAKRKKYNIKYRLGIENKRIQSDVLMDQFSVVNNNMIQSAAEFFHYKMNESKRLMTMFKYYSIYHWLVNDSPERLLGCAWKDEGVTLDSRGEVYYCAVASKSLGSLRDSSGTQIFFDDKNIKYRKSIIKNNCDNCIHDYRGRPEYNNLLKFLVYIIKNRFAMKIYKYKTFSAL